MIAPTITLPRMVATDWAASELIRAANLDAAVEVIVSARQVSTITQRFVFALVAGLANTGVRTIELTGATAGLFEAFTAAADGTVRVTTPTGEPSYHGLLNTLRDAVYTPDGVLRSDQETAAAVRHLLTQAGVHR